MLHVAIIVSTQVFNYVHLVLYTFGYQHIDIVIVIYIDRNGLVWNTTGEEYLLLPGFVF